MGRQSILTILVLLLSLLIGTGCASSEKAAQAKDALPEKAMLETAEFETEETTSEMIELQQAANAESAEDVIGVFEGLEDNHTAIFSFDGAEKAFYFDTPGVQEVLWEAVIGSSYTLSYEYTETDFYRGLVITKISE